MKHLQGLSVYPAGLVIYNHVWGTEICVDFHLDLQNNTKQDKNTK